MKKSTGIILSIVVSLVIAVIGVGIAMSTGETGNKVVEQADKGVDALGDALDKAAGGIK